jgi:hypothetical protein
MYTVLLDKVKSHPATSFWMLVFLTFLAILLFALLLKEISKATTVSKFKGWDRQGFLGKGAGSILSEASNFIVGRNEAPVLSQPLNADIEASMSATASADSASTSTDYSDTTDTKSKMTDRQLARGDARIVH